MRSAGRQFSINWATESGVSGQRLTLPASIEDGRNPVGLDRFVYTLCGLLLMALVWASFAQIREFARAPGQITPAGSLKLVNHLEGGNVERVPVSEGDIVNKGDVLVELRPTAAASDLEQFNVRKANLLMRAESLDALTSGGDLRLGDLQARYPALANTQLEQFRSERAALVNERKTLSAPVAQHKAEMESAERELAIANGQIDIQREQLSIRERLLAKGYVSRVDYLDANYRVAAAKAYAVTIEGKVATAQEQLAEARSRLEEADAKSRSKYAEEQAKTTSEIAEVTQTIAKYQDRVDLLTVRAPAHGIIHELSKRAAGEVVKPGDLVAKIVPLDGQMVAEVRLDPKEIGHVHIGDEAEIKTTAFDPNVYGIIKGKVERISATTFQTEKGEVYFKATIRLEKSYLGSAENPIPIMPGMVVEADIITGAKSLVRYLLKPVYRSLSVAFSER
jgi:membrane fusion protein, adhesin transport system